MSKRIFSQRVYLAFARDLSYKPITLNAEANCTALPAASRATLFYQTKIAATINPIIVNQIVNVPLLLSLKAGSGLHH